MYNSSVFSGALAAAAIVIHLIQGFAAVPVVLVPEASMLIRFSE